MKRVIASVFASLVLLSTAPAQAQLLQGRIEEGAITQKATTPKYQVEQPQLDTATIKEHCSCLDPDRVEAVEIDGQWKLVDAQNKSLLSLGNSESAARDAVHLIKFYGINQTCTLSAQGSVEQLHYFLKDGQAPTGPMEQEDAIDLSRNSIKAELIKGSWKVTSGEIWMLDFGADQESAMQAAEALRFHGFSHHCFVGNPARKLMYFRR